MLMLNYVKTSYIATYDRISAGVTQGISLKLVR